MIRVESPFDGPVEGLSDGVWSVLEKVKNGAPAAADLGGPRGHGGVTGVGFRHFEVMALDADGGTLFSAGHAKHFFAGWVCGDHAQSFEGIG